MVGADPTMVAAVIGVVVRAAEWSGRKATVDVAATTRGIVENPNALTKATTAKMHCWLMRPMTVILVQPALGFFYVSTTQRCCPSANGSCCCMLVLCFVAARPDVHLRFAVCDIHFGKVLLANV